MSPFDSKQFEVKREDQAIARWIGPKDDETIAQLLDLFRREKWKGQLVISMPEMVVVSDVVFTDARCAGSWKTKEDLPY